MSRQLRCPRCHSTDLEVVQYKCNFSAFNGYHHTPSDRSGVRCRDCGHYWRTYSNAVDDLPPSSEAARVPSQTDDSRCQPTA